MSLSKCILLFLLSISPLNTINGCESVYFLQSTVIGPCNIVGVPSQPGIPQVTDITGTSCKLSWQAPSSDGGSPITGYVVERRSGGYPL